MWDGRANLGEFNVSGKAGRIEGLSLRLFDPAANQWRIFWANAKDGDLDPTPMVGSFTNGRGEFHAQEMVGGRRVSVRFLFSDITATSFRLEQAFSADAGKTWEANWIVQFTRAN